MGGFSGTGASYTRYTAVVAASGSWLRTLLSAARARLFRAVVAHVHRGVEDKVPRIARCSAGSSTHPWRGGRGVSRETAHAMTRDRRRKAEVRVRSAATGEAYMVARRQVVPPTLAEVMQEHPLLGAYGIGVFADLRRKTPEQRRTELAAVRGERPAGRARWRRPPRGWSIT